MILYKSSGIPPHSISENLETPFVMFSHNISAIIRVLFFIYIIDIISFILRLFSVSIPISPRINPDTPAESDAELKE